MAAAARPAGGGGADDRGVHPRPDDGEGGHDAERGAGGASGGEVGARR